MFSTGRHARGESSTMTRRCTKWTLVTATATLDGPAGLALGGPRTPWVVHGPYLEGCGWSDHPLRRRVARGDHPDGGDGWMPGRCT